MQIYVYVHNVSTGDYDNDYVNIIGDLFFYTTVNSFVEMVKFLLSNDDNLFFLSERIGSHKIP